MLKDQYIQFTTHLGIDTKHLLVNQDNAKGLALILPGANNISERPILHLTRKVLLDLGYDTLNIDYANVLNYGLDENEFFQQLINLVEGVLKTYKEHFLQENESFKLILVGRSLGSIIGAMIIKEGKYVFEKTIFYSPSNRTINHLIDGKILLVTSRDAPYMTEESFDKLNDFKTIEKLILSGLDHNLEAENSIEKTLITLDDVIMSAKDFLLL